MENLEVSAQLLLWFKGFSLACGIMCVGLAIRWFMNLGSSSNSPDL